MLQGLLSTLLRRAHVIRSMGCQTSDMFASGSLHSMARCFTQQYVLRKAANTPGATHHVHDSRPKSLYDPEKRATYVDLYRFDFDLFPEIDAVVPRGIGVTLHDTRATVVTSQLAEELSRCSDAELIAATFRAVNEVGVECLERESIARLEQLDVDNLLKLAYSFLADQRRQHYCKHFIAHFFEVCYKKFSELFHRPLDVVRLSYLMSLRRTAPPSLLDAIEQHVLGNLQLYTCADLSYVCFGFYVCNTPINELELLHGIASRLLAEHQSLDLHQICNILKTFRLSNFLKVTFYDEFSNVLCGREDVQQIRYPSLLTSLLESFAARKFYYPDLMDLLNGQALRVFESKLTRSKEHARLLLASGIIGHDPGEEIKTFIISRLREKLRANPRDLLQYPENLINSVKVLAYYDCFPHDLIDFVLSKQMIERVQAYTRMRKEFDLYHIDQSLPIVCPEYSGNRLPQDITERQEEKLDMSKELRSRKGLSASFRAISNVLGDPDHVKCSFLLPHFRKAELEIHVDNETNRTIAIRGCKDPLPSETALFNNHRGKTPPKKWVFSRVQLLPTAYPDKKIRKLAIQHLNLKACPRNDSSHLLGNQKWRIHQQHKLGYDVILVPHDTCYMLYKRQDRFAEEAWRSYLNDVLNVKLPSL